MDKLILLLAAVLGVLIAYMLKNFPWITRYFEPMTLTWRSSGGKIVIFSDTHIKEGGLPQSLAEFIVKEKFDVIIAAGDLIEYGHRRIKENVLKQKLVEVFDRIIRESSVKEIFYVVSMSSHDPKINRVLDFMAEGKRITVVPGVLIIENSGKFYITHGDYASRNGSIARILNRIFDLWTEKKLRSALKLPKDAWLICGHTHIPRIDTKLRIANTGSWRGKLLAKPAYTLVTIDIDGGLVTLIEVK